jgi:hypothetical protein
MDDPGKVIVALGFFGTVTYIVRLLVLRVFGDGKASGSGLVVDEDRMARLEQAVEAISLEVERISEGQRFTTKLLSDRAAADPVRGIQPSEPPRRITPH